MAKPWEELHTQIATNEEYEKSIAYKGLTCVCSTLSLRVALLRLPAQPFPGSAPRTPRGRVLCVERLGWVRLTWGRASAVATLGMEVHAGWCGPSTAVVPTLKKLQWDMVEERRYSPRP